MAQIMPSLLAIDPAEVEAAMTPVPWPDAGDWHVLHTKSRQEKALSDNLAAQGVPHYLPMIAQVRYVGRRKVSGELPLFPSYVFLKGSLDDTYLADRTKRVARIIPVTNQQMLEWELRNIYMAMAQRVALDPHAYLRAGMRVRVISGPLKGIEGLVEHRAAKRSRLVLQVQTLGRALSLEIEASLLESV